MHTCMSLVIIFKFILPGYAVCGRTQFTAPCSLYTYIFDGEKGHITIIVAIVISFPFLIFIRVDVSPWSC